MAPGFVVRTSAELSRSPQPDGVETELAQRSVPFETGCGLGAFPIALGASRPLRPEAPDKSPDTASLPGCPGVGYRPLASGQCEHIGS